MRVRWFGEPWGSDQKRAPVCEDDQFRVPVPVGTKCLVCGERIKEGQRGIVTACSPSIFGHWRLKTGGGTFSVCSYHFFPCWLKETIGLELAEKLVSKMDWEIKDELPEGLTEERLEELADEAEAGYDVEPGRGWGQRQEE